MQNEIKTSERPLRYDPLIIAEVHEYIASVIRDWSNDIDQENSLEYAKCIQWHCFHDNGFELAVKLEDLSPDAMLVDMLDTVAGEQSDIMDKYVKKWVQENNILCPLKIGDLCTINDGHYRGTEAEIKKVYADVARYGIWHEKMNCPKEGNMVQIVDMEKVIPKNS